LVTEKNTLVTARPSGTEPKIKFYFSVRMAVENWPNGDYSRAMEELEGRIGELKQEMGVA
jgi:phosphoglucomutase